MARTYHHRPRRITAAERPYLSPFAGTGSRTRHQRTAHKRDRAALRRALRNGTEPPRPRSRRVKPDAH